MRRKLLIFQGDEFGNIFELCSLRSIDWIRGICEKWRNFVSYFQVIGRMIVCRSSSIKISTHAHYLDNYNTIFVSRNRRKKKQDRNWTNIKSVLKLSIRVSSLSFEPPEFARDISRTANFEPRCILVSLCEGERRVYVSHFMHASQVCRIV